MRFFKHGSVLAISLPESLRQKLGIAENDEYEFIERPDGSLGLVKKSAFDPAGAHSPKASPVPATKTAPTPSTAAAKTTITTMAKPASTATPPAKPGSFYATTNTLLDRQGFLVLDNEMDAKAFSQRFESAIKAGDIKGVRGFDKKFYLASRAYSEAFADKLLVALKDPHTTSELATLAKQPNDGILTILYLLKEEGEVIEKKRGLFVRVL